MAKVIVDDHTAEVLAALKEKKAIALASIGQECEGYAKKNCPVDTGRLKNSITNKVVKSEDAVYVGTNVEYAPYVEYNEKARHDPPKFGGGKAHFLRDAAANHRDHYQQIVEAVMKS